ncbi:2-dehydro-3-deoxyglucarate aldolase [Rhodococcus erythropolis]|uniref:aldolase/citrate lyase family protein n=1 Tax=Rhodococcus qingshengii TaxID=334542 RepID=UPI000937F8D9|nr:aldolase/citrate lyase family protein [Rhodococcus qingshengii]MCZ4547300.1 aldolase/citrate lyase family protein [Rhodococcus qingshengii]OKA12526.1 2-dehydro-3-deoxyglucarate aldolase [Rhodococcus erythropolis]REK78098.1 2-dehydro-3-deoxyglucarate aldolase [Rhodococcus erythropolis]
MTANSWRELLSTGTAQFGMWVASGNSYTAEICAGSGLDWLMLDQEHVPNDLRSTLAQLQAVAPYPIEVLVRPASGDAVVIKQLLDIGATNLIVPMVESADEAAALVAATRYPPNGIRGVGSALARASHWNRTSDYLITADEGISLTVQVESTAGLEALKDIASTPGVDAVFIGPADLAASMGYLGRPHDPVVVEAVERAISDITACGTVAGVNAFDETLARRYIAAGARFVLVGADVTILSSGSDELARRYVVTDKNS